MSMQKLLSIFPGLLLSLLISIVPLGSGAMAAEVTWTEFPPSDGISFSPVDLKVEGDYIFATGDDNQLHVLDISDMANPVWISHLQLPGDASDIEISNNMAFIAGRKDGVYIVDISSPDKPSLVDIIDTPGSASALEVDEPYIYVASGIGGLQIIEMNLPDNSSIVADVELPGRTGNVVELDGYVYATSNKGTISQKTPGMYFTQLEWGGLHVINVTNPLTPVLVTSVKSLYGIAAYLDASETQALITCFFSKSGLSMHGEDNFDLWIVDISNPELPRTIEVVNLHSTPSDITYRNGYAYVSGYGKLKVTGNSFNSERFVMEIVNVASEGSYGVTSIVEIPGFAMSVDVTPDYAFVSCYLSDQDKAFLDFVPGIRASVMKNGIAAVSLQVKESAEIVMFLNTK